MLIKIEKLPSGTKSQTDIANNQVSKSEKNKKKKKDVQMANMYTRKWSASYIIREMQNGIVMM